MQLLVKYIVLVAWMKNALCLGYTLILNVKQAYENLVFPSHGHKRQKG